MIAVIQFFRDPMRCPPDGDTWILSPADGRVISIDKAVLPPAGSAKHSLSIFMSPVNVHVNRAPCDCVVMDVKHRKGKFKSAFKPEAERENECVSVELSTPYGKMTLNLVAGFLARRIEFHPKPGDHLVKGQRMGMIRFGSRVDMFLPANTGLYVQAGEKVIAGKTKLGEFLNGSQENTA